jgi:hypothetical protein
MANQRGQDGSVTVGAIALDELRSWGLDGVTLEMIDDTVKGDTHRTFKGGIGDGGTISLSCWLDYTTAQQDMIDLINAGTGDAVAFELLAATGKKFTGNAVPGSYSTSSPEGSALVEITFTMKVSGAVGVTWA